MPANAIIGGTGLMRTVKLGLIGDNIRSSSAPALHQIAAAQHGIDLSYELIIPAERQLDFDSALYFARDGGFTGVNVTLPYKERAFGYVDIDDAAVRQLGSVNTICFGPNGLTGANTDFTGFLKCYRAARGNQKAGRVLLIGAGGVGRSIGFALTQLGASALHVIDKDQQKAANFVKAISQFVPDLAVVADMTRPTRFDALVNCSPAGMDGYGGLPLPETMIPADLDWAFDAVYQPVETPFKQTIEARGVQFISGFELFFHQGVDAFSIFTGFDVKDEVALRDVLFKRVCTGALS